MTTVFRAHEVEPVESLIARALIQPELFCARITNLPITGADCSPWEGLGSWHVRAIVTALHAHGWLRADP